MPCTSVRDKEDWMRYWVEEEVGCRMTGSRSFVVTLIVCTVYDEE